MLFTGQIDDVQWGKNVICDFAVKNMLFQAITLSESHRQPHAGSQSDEFQFFIV